MHERERDSVFAVLALLERMRGWLSAKAWRQAGNASENRWTSPQES